MERPQPQNQVVSPSISKPVVMDKTSTTQRMVQRHTYTSTLVVPIHTSEQPQVHQAISGFITPLMVA